MAGGAPRPLRARLPTPSLPPSPPRGVSVSKRGGVHGVVSGQVEKYPLLEGTPLQELAQNALGGGGASNLTDPPLPQQLAQAVGGGLTPPLSTWHMSMGGVGPPHQHLASSDGGSMMCEINCLPPFPRYCTVVQ